MVHFSTTDNKSFVKLIAGGVKFQTVNVMILLE